MSAECHDCGADLVGWGADMYCSRCKALAERDKAQQQRDRIRETLSRESERERNRADKAQQQVGELRDALCAIRNDVLFEPRSQLAVFIDEALSAFNEQGGDARGEDRRAMSETSTGVDAGRQDGKGEGASVRAGAHPPASFNEQGTGEAEPEKCERCKGNGRIEMLEHCPACHGTGKQPAETEEGE